MTRRTAELCFRQTWHENIYLHVVVPSIIIILFREQKCKICLMFCKHPEVFKIINDVEFNKRPVYYVKRVF